MTDKDGATRAAMRRVVAKRAGGSGFETSVEQDHESLEWTCYCSKSLTPTVRALIRIQSELDSLARDVGG